VGDLFRICDVMFMPSLREGFAMPVLEGGLAGVPVVCTAVPAAEELGGADVIQFDLEQTAEEVADQILAWADGSRVHRLRRRVRQGYTWAAILKRDIEPLLARGASGGV
jgi:glycosyltransferase involved in cell wall biosynthesis